MNCERLSRREGLDFACEQAAFPMPGLRDYKFWPAVGRIDGVYSDRNPICTCAGMENCS